MHRLPAQIEEAVFETRFLGIVDVGIDRERQRIGLGLQHEFGDLDLDLAGRERRVDRLGRARQHHAGDRDDAFQLQRDHPGEHRAAAVDHDLGHAVIVAQIDEQQLAMVAGAVDPTAEPHGLPGVAQLQLTAGMGPVGVHGRGLLITGAASGRLQNGHGDTGVATGPSKRRRAPCRPRFVKRWAARHALAAGRTLA